MTGLRDFGGYWDIAQRSGSTVPNLGTAGALDATINNIPTVDILPGRAPRVFIPNSTAANRMETSGFDAGLDGALEWEVAFFVEFVQAPSTDVFILSSVASNTGQNIVVKPGGNLQYVIAHPTDGTKAFTSPVPLVGAGNWECLYSCSIVGGSLTVKMQARPRYSAAPFTISTPGSQTFTAYASSVGTARFGTTVDFEDFTLEDVQLFNGPTNNASVVGRLIPADLAPGASSFTAPLPPVTVNVLRSVAADVTTTMIIPARSHSINNKPLSGGTNITWPSGLAVAADQNLTYAVAFIPNGNTSGTRTLIELNTPTRRIELSSSGAIRASITDDSANTATTGFLEPLNNANTVHVAVAEFIRGGNLTLYVYDDQGLIGTRTVDASAVTGTFAASIGSALVNSPASVCWFAYGPGITMNADERDNLIGTVLRRTTSPPPSPAGNLLYGRTETPGNLAEGEPT